MEVHQLPRNDSLLIPGRLGSTLFSGTPNTNVLAVYLDFEQGRAKSMGKEKRRNVFSLAGLEDWDAGQA